MKRKRRKYFEDFINNYYRMGINCYGQQFFCSLSAIQGIRVILLNTLPLFLFGGALDKMDAIQRKGTNQHL
jgi:hypothetical protein